MEMRTPVKDHKLDMKVLAGFIAILSYCIYYYIFFRDDEYSKIKSRLSLSKSQDPGNSES
jgi:hypothetical protein